MRSTLLLTILCAAAAGCHDHGSPDDMSMNDMSAGGDDMSIADMGPPDDFRQYVSFTQFAMDYAQAVCAHSMACGQLDAAQLNACIERKLRQTGWDQDVEITKGRMSINELQCLDAIKNSRCDSSDLSAWLSRCVRFLYTPKQTNGSACLAPEECISGYCQHGGSDAGMIEQPNGCPGVCADPKPTGAACRVGSDCTPNSYCDIFGDKLCHKLAALNEPCLNGAFVGTGTLCQYGLLCPTFSSAPTCVMPAMQGTLHGACDPYQGAATPTPACGDGMYCKVNFASGTACTQQSQCTAGALSYCDTAAGVCKDATGGTCETKLASGSDCDPNSESMFSDVDNQCADGSLCTQLPGQTKNTCQAYGSAGADCSVPGQCKIGLMCVSGKCAPWVGDGQACTGNEQCASLGNVCIADNADAGASLTCQPAKSFGASCVPGFEDSLCAQTDLPGSTGCVPTTGGMGVCAPKCY